MLPPFCCAVVACHIQHLGHFAIKINDPLLGYNSFEMPNGSVTKIDNFSSHNSVFNGFQTRTFTEFFTECVMYEGCSLFVFSINGLKQNARSLLTPFSNTDFYPLLHGSLHFVLHGSSNNHLFQRFWLAVEDFQPIRRWLKKLPWRAKARVPCERA